MKLIVFHPKSSTFSNFGYSASIRIGYLLNGHLATAGIQEQEYKLNGVAKNWSLEEKINYLKGRWDDETSENNALSNEKTLKEIARSKSKSSEMIVLSRRIKKIFDDAFEHYTSESFIAFDSMLRVKAMKDLINPNYFYFYHLPGDVVHYDNQPETSVLEIMQLLLPDPEKEHPIFLINLHQETGEHYNVDILFPENKLAKNPDSIYGEEGFIFPMMTNMSTNEICEARKQLELPTQEFRDKIDQWAAICYKSPRTDAGLKFFRKNLGEFIFTYKNKAMESLILKNVSDVTRRKSQSQIIIGEAPVETIWRIYRDTKAISEEQYNELMTIRTEQYPKFEGRWPVMFFAAMEDDLNVEAPSSEEFKSVRKSISVD